MNKERSTLNEYWVEIITKFRAGNYRQNCRYLQKDYAKENNLKVYSLGYWHRKFNTGFSGFIEAIDNPKKNQDNLGASIEIIFNKMKIVIKDSYVYISGNIANVNSQRNTS